KPERGFARVKVLVMLAGPPMSPARDGVDFLQRFQDSLIDSAVDEVISNRPEKPLGPRRIHRFLQKPQNIGVILQREDCFRCLGTESEPSVDTFQNELAGFANLR